MFTTALGTAQTFINVGNNQPPELTVTASSDVTICNGNNTVLTSTAAGGTGTYDYTWAPSTNLSSTTNDTTTASPTANQAYTISVEDTRNCTASDNVSVTVVDCSGLDQIKEVTSFNLYPNPSDGIVNFGLVFNKKTNDLMVQIFNANGQLVLTKDYNKPGIDVKDVFDLTTSAPGNYMFMITIGNSSMTKTFIIK